MFRFSDPRLEKLYCNYYAQVKGNLLPTAIQVALLTNVVQLVATCLRGLTGTPWIIALALQLSTLCVSYLALRRVRADLDASRNNSDDNDRRLDVRVSIGSGLSASLSLAIEPESDNDDDDEEHHQRQHQNPADNHFRLLQRSKVDGAKRASTLSNQNNLTKLPRFQLLLPYILWLCQMVQLASGLWPQLSFISYSILLLYSYTIYVIVPIRLTSCLVLALLLSVSQPVVDHLILLNLQPESQPLSHLLHLLHTRSTGSISLPSFLLAASSTAPPPLSHHPQAPVNHYPSAANFRHQASQPNQANYLQFYPSISSSLSSASIRQPRASVYQDTLAANETANSLLIPMTSHMPKLLAFILLVVGINLIGVMSFFFYERQQRAAFLETRQSLETKLTLEQESQEQERLLLSILPKHLAAEIRQDLGAVVTGQFKKIYMSRHENVSILFADIVGFTAISSHCQAAELVSTLNELFARFDKLAEKYHQLRIKILGDCYYAISGAPKERPDHAVLCVHMGLSMVDAIRSVREKTKSTVDMRVGVHTGAVLAGVLGQRQWQFDVYSKDVELANKMESSGLPGRVHISNATLKFLNDEFEVSEADGEAREEALRMANIKTYFIERVLKPYPEGTLDANIGLNAFSGEQSELSLTPNSVRKVRTSGTSNGKAHNYRDYNNVKSNNNSSSSTSNNNNKIDSHRDRNSKHKKHKSDISRQQMSSDEQPTESTSLTGNGGNKKRNDSFNIDHQIKRFSLNFTNSDLEQQFRSTSDIASCISLVALPLTLLCAFIAHLYLYSVQKEVAIIYASSILLLSLAVLFCVSPYVSHWSRPNLADIVRRSAWMKLALTALMTLVWLSAHFIALQRTNANLELLTKSRPVKLFTVDLFNYFAIACSLAITAVTRISFLVKTILIVVVILLQVLANLGLLSRLIAMRLPVSQPPASSELDKAGGFRIDAHVYDQCIFTLTLLTICSALFLINRQFELTNRRLFLWRKQVEERKEKVADMRRKNEALVYNILPPNVAKIFLGKRIINDEELYSKSYEAVGVLFAAMPNFSDFYTEESVNNQGLECLRFLNEVISDYDALLDQDRFKNIIKIKTMGSTYMAASGLYEGDAIEEANARAAARNDSDRKLSCSADDEDPLRSKWGHLEQLTEFALALKDTLNNINRESFNNFVLRIGINQGPITAGVIGAKKPHFDMWGNTVNVASRMESTGRAGSIQVVEETAVILRRFGFKLEQRGLVSVKGKGQLMTFYLIGRE